MIKIINSRVCTVTVNGVYYILVDGIRVGDLKL